MTSHSVEKSHKEDLNQLFRESGLTCIRTRVQSDESSALSEESEVKMPSKELEEESTDMEVEEESVFMSEMMEEQGPEIFPSPSLRRVLPDKIRMIEKQNQIHVLPEKFITQIDPLRIPRISTTPAYKYISELAEMTGCKTYHSSLAEYWFLDTMANLLRRAQEDGLDRENQTILMNWFCEWMKEMQHFDAATRVRMQRRFKETMLSAARYVASEDRIPAPLDIGVTYKADDDLNVSHPSPTPVDSKHLVTFENFQCCLYDLTKMLHYIFDLSVFTFTPEYQLIDAPHKLQTPKRLFTPYVKPKVKEKAPKKEKEQKSDGKKGKKKEVDTEEYLHLLSLQADIEKEKEEEIDKQREDWHRRTHILPLAFAITDEFFDKYWPPPTPEIVEEPEPEPKGKGKGKKK